jgi:hypothetical protein
MIAPFQDFYRRQNYTIPRIFASVFRTIPRIFFIGFLHCSKNPDSNIKIFNRLHNKPDACLVLLMGNPWSQPMSPRLQAYRPP